MAKTLTVQQHTKSAPHAAAKARTTRRLVLEVMERDLCRLVEEAVAAEARPMTEFERIFGGLVD